MYLQCRLAHNCKYNFCTLIVIYSGNFYIAKMIPTIYSSAHRLEALLVGINIQGT